MRQFRDSAGREWQVAVNIGTAMQVKASLGLDLLSPEAGDPPLITRLTTDEFLLGSVICQLLAKQMEQRTVTEADVMAAFDGTTLLAAQEAFFEELIGFFQSRGRLDRAAAVSKHVTVLRQAVDLATARVNAIDPQKILGEASGASPG